MKRGRRRDRRSSRRARRAAARSSAPSSDVPARRPRDAAARRAFAAPRRRGCPRSQSPRSCATTCALQAQLRPGLGLLSARVVHDEAQPAPARARRRAARPRAAAPAAGPRARAGRARADVEPAGRARRRSPACRTSRCSPRPARTASSRACCSRAPTTRIAARRATRCSRPTPPTGPTRRPSRWPAWRSSSSRPTRRGGIDLDDLRAKADADVACLMLTNPNTLGLFDPNIEEIAEIVHGVGATLYYDGANLNAVMGISRPGDMGFDIVHFNLHKSFTQPHGGGGPGSGPIAVSERIAPFLPTPLVVRREAARAGRRRRAVGARRSTSTTARRRSRQRSIGRLRGFHGNYGCFVRAYAYICSLGAEGLRDASETAVLNANYLLARLARARRRRAPAARLRRAVHARVRALRRADEARAADPDARPRQAAAGLRLSPADRLLPAARGGGADGRADRDRDQGDARRLRRGDRGDPRGGRAGGPRGRARRALHDAGRRLDEVAAAKHPVIRQALA